MMDRPIAVIIDCRPNSSKMDGENFLRDLFAGVEQEFPQKNSMESSPDENNSESNNIYYPLRLETKYYSAEVGVRIFPGGTKPTIGDKRFADAVEAVVLICSSSISPSNSTNSSDSAESRSIIAAADSWLSYIEHWEETGVKLLVYQRGAGGTDNNESSSVQKWCVKHDFECIHLNPDEDAISEAQECGELTGVGRILQALKAYSWSNLIMKDERSVDADRAERLRNYLLNKKENDAEEEEEQEQEKKDLNSDHQQSDDDPFGEFVDSSRRDNDDEDDENDFAAFGGGGGSAQPSAFEDLFSKFAAMKATSAALPDAERKAYAERVAMEFWRAIGDGEGEEGGLSHHKVDDNMEKGKEK